MKKKRHRTIDPAKARAASGGGIDNWYQQMNVVDTRATCSRCGTRTALVGQDGECLRCRLERRKAIREQGVVSKAS